MKCLILVTLILFSKTAWSKSVEKPPLVLQMTVSHPRNTDQTSLIFKGKRLLYITNVHQSSVKSKELIRLGQFQTPITPLLNLLKRQIQVYKKELVKNSRNPLKITLNKSGVLRSIAYVPQTRPHETRILIGRDGMSREVKDGHPYFQPLKKILIKARQSKYKCTSCAFYYKKGKSIIRVVKEQNQSPQRRSFSRQQLNCHPLGKKKMECVDEAYGIFEI